MKRRSLLSITLASVLGVSGFFTYQSSAFASKLSNLQNEQKEVQEKSSTIDSNIDKKTGEISEIKGKQDDLQTEMEQIDFSIADTDQKIQEKQQQIENTQQKVTELKEQVNALKQRIEERNQLLQQRARSMQTSGGSVNYLDVILGADSIGDLIDRVTAVTTLVNADKQIIDEQKKDKASLQKKQADVEKQLANLEKMVGELQGMKAELNQQKVRKNEVMKELGKQKKKLENDKLSLEEEQGILSAQESAIKKAIQLEKDRIAEENRKQAQAKTQSHNRVASSGGSAGVPPISSGTFTRPAQGYVSSEFGNRDLDADGFHSGIDIAKAGTVPIVAAGDGVVSRSYLSSSYGNCIFITHSVNGKIFTTVYAHMRSRSLGDGAVVSKGQVIGYMGATGEAYGQHLHFEFYVGEWTASHSNAVNPRNYINF